MNRSDRVVIRILVHSWWQQIRKPLVVIAVIALLAGVLVLLILTGYRLTWTGFSNRTLWDWLNLLGVLAIPAVVGLGAAWYTAQQGKVSDRQNTDNQRETALQAYIDNMSELLLEKHLRKSQPEDEVRKIARVRTLTILPRLDADRKRSVLQFLYECALIDKDKCIIDLRGADLSEAHLGGLPLSEANLSGASLTGADLSEANLREADLRRANLRAANLRAANLEGACLDTAYLGSIPFGYGSDYRMFTGPSGVLGGINLREANLHGTFLRHADLSDVDLSGADLHGDVLASANLSRANLGGANLREADLGFACLLAANLRGADLRGADLRGANLRRADLSAADLRGADLSGSASVGGEVTADLRGADLRGADLRGAIITQEQWEKARSLQGATMPDGKVHP